MEVGPVITVVGCGRMGSLLTKKLVNNYKVYVYDKNQEKAQDLNNTCAAEVINLENFKKANIVILALDSEIINQAITEIQDYLAEDAILVNIATSFPHEKVKAKHRIVSAKIVGHAKEIAIGEKPVIIVESADISAQQKVAEVFEKIGKVLIGESNIVTKINTIASRHGIIGNNKKNSQKNS